MMSMTKNRSDRYPNGYSPKISFWGKMIASASSVEEYEYAKQKFLYFLEREAQRLAQ